MTAAQFSAHASARTEPPWAGIVHIRHRHDSHFTVVGNHLAQHPYLSAVAIGLGVYIQSLPDGARVGIKDLTRRFREGEITIARALRELEKAGYLERRRVRADGGVMVTRTSWYERPGCRESSAPPQPRRRVVDLVKRKKEPPLPPADPPAADVPAGLRRRDPRLVLSERDVHRLAPGVRAWLDRGVTAGQIARTLSGQLPLGAIAWPARLLGYRLTTWLPPVLPARPDEPPSLPVARADQPLPFQTCDGCDRAFRAAGPGKCRDCRLSTAA
ncbi:helix-turn-helix domain-containing protein [Streptomyces sp. ISL-11]|uniref:helix-turn-helix domain-containing protein n=1 Tax=Streptomyces sp. ISL-11 TaxID=2819174 RepID=UPI001BEC31F3|nr:helix-turn-helix domain-containing protein [Streptomyces sp. ISL-11]MBT2385786.1 helix-turn-helix domain-containing protein [Streptomyces sp. ISL-11]